MCTWSIVEGSGFEVTFSGSSSFSAPLSLCPGLSGTAPCPTAAPLGRVLISIIASSLWCCDSPAPQQGHLDLLGIYTLLRCIIDFIIISLHMYTRHCVLKQTLQGRTALVISPCSSDPFAYSQITCHRLQACFVDHDENIGHFKTDSHSELLLFLILYVCAS